MFKTLRIVRVVSVCLCLVFSAQSVVLGYSEDNIQRYSYDNCIPPFDIGNQTCYQCSDKNEKKVERCFPKKSESRFQRLLVMAGIIGTLGTAFGIIYKAVMCLRTTYCANTIVGDETRLITSSSQSSSV
jgi:hypothetical protein